MILIICFCKISDLPNYFYEKKPGNVISLYSDQRIVAIYATVTHQAIE